MKGTYVLVMELRKDSRIKIGQLGLIDFAKGYYCYVGSALGKSMNLENRIGRHKKLDEEKNGKLRWHIDYFLTNPNTSIIQTVIINSSKRLECKVSKTIEQNAETTIHDFGSSDCRCTGHLHCFKDRNSVGKQLEELVKIG